MLAGCIVFEFSFGVVSRPSYSGVRALAFVARQPRALRERS